MLEFIRSGGFPILVVIGFGLATMVTAAMHAYRPTIRRADIVRALSAATVFSTLAAVAACVGAVMHHVPGNPQWAKSPDLPLIVMTGLGESMSPAIMGFSMLALAWMLCAIASRREA